jgi:hypothetical protein
LQISENLATCRIVATDNPTHASVPAPLASPAGKTPNEEPTVTDENEKHSRKQELIHDKIEAKQDMKIRKFGKK